MMPAVIAAAFLLPVTSAAPNNWMKQPTPISESRDSQLPERAARDAFWDQGFRYIALLTPANARDVQISEGSVYRVGPPPAIPVYEDRVLLIGKFLRHKSVLSSSRHCVYSEIAIGVEDLFEFGKSPAASGGELTVILAGGSVSLPDGQVISFLTQPRHFSLQREHEYLLALAYQRDGNFYSVAESWDVSDGTVRVNSGTAVLPGIVGLTRTQLVARLKGAASLR